MAPGVYAQGLWFLGAVLLGMLLGLVYHILRGLRSFFPKLTVPCDLLFLGLTAWACAYLGLVICKGYFQLPQGMGLVLGGALYAVTAGRLLDRPLLRLWSLSHRGIRRAFTHIKKLMPHRRVSTKTPGKKQEKGGEPPGFF